MKVLVTKSDIQEELSDIKKEGKSVGFVPTMGALHEGHLSLVKRAKKENDIVIVSVFVNPLQFDDKKDFENYPITGQADYSMLVRANVNFLFRPEEEEIYPNKESKKVEFDPGQLGKILEGKSRKGHFEGVATVVQNLFDIIKPNRAYFGQKDYQQFKIIEKLIKDKDWDIEAIMCPIIREKDGLAQSSRNRHLKANDRRRASNIYRTLNRAKVKLISQKPAEVEEWGKEYLNKFNEFEVDYFVIRNPEDLKPLKSVENGAIILTAVHVGGIRLIDNMII